MTGSTPPACADPFPCFCTPHPAQQKLPCRAVESVHLLQSPSDTRQATVCRANSLPPLPAYPMPAGTKAAGMRPAATAATAAPAAAAPCAAGTCRGSHCLPAVAARQQRGWSLSKAVMLASCCCPAGSCRCVHLLVTRCQKRHQELCYVASDRLHASTHRLTCGAQFCYQVQCRQGQLQQPRALLLQSLASALKPVLLQCPRQLSAACLCAFAGCTRRAQLRWLTPLPNTLPQSAHYPLTV